MRFFNCPIKFDGFIQWRFQLVLISRWQVSRGYCPIDQIGAFFQAIRPAKHAQKVYDGSSICCAEPKRRGHAKHNWIALSQPCLVAHNA